MICIVDWTIAAILAIFFPGVRKRVWCGCKRIAGRSHG